MDNSEDARTMREIAAMICGIILACAIIFAFTYSCTSPTLVNEEAQAVRTIQHQQMQACLARGDSWIPVRRYAKDSSPLMSCVTSETLPLVTKMNTES